MKFNKNIHTINTIELIIKKTNTSIELHRIDSKVTLNSLTCQKISATYNGSYYKGTAVELVRAINARIIILTCITPDIYHVEKYINAYSASGKR